MRKHPAPESGVFNPRLLFAFSLCCGAALLAMLSFASTPPTSGITVPSTANQTVTVTWTGSIPPGANASSDCSALADTPAADQHVSTVNVPAGAYNSVNAKFTFNITWPDTAGNDEILTVLKPDGTTLDSSDGGTPSETVEGTNLPAGAYKIIACGFLSGPDPQTYSGKLTITTASGGPPSPPPTPTPAPAAAGVPRYYNYAPPAAIGEASGEPSIGYNLATHKAMYIAGLQTLRITFPEELTPKGSIPQACAAQWDDVSTPLTHTKSLDPILFTDQRTGRTFVSQLNSVVPPAAPVLIGLNSLMAYSDDDGVNWIPAQVNPPDGSYDHQTVGAGPYPASLPLGNPVNKGSAVYYCAQAGVTAFCSRSDDGGLNFGKAMAVYTSVNPVGFACGGIHGHVKVAPDGTVYLPDRGCDGKQAVIVSEDAGTTWTVRQVTTSKPPPGILDPSVGIASDGTLYFSYINSDGHAHVAVSHNKGVTWINDRDIGISQGNQNAVFIEAVAGDPNRAAVGFIGTTQSGNHEAADFNGTWYAFIGHTYDGGLTWTTVNATPDAPVQREACIWNEGGANVCRNLLDFNEITMDERGRVLYAYADGCIGDCESGGPNSYSSKATIARQSGGKGLLATQDPIEPAAPQSACLSGRRDDQASYLRWVVPDNGGSDITLYRIFRGTAPGNEVLIGQQVGGKTTYNDRTANPGVATYTYKIAAVNSLGTGSFSNIVSLTVGPRAESTGSCTLPGNTIITDPVGDETDTVPQHDITSISMAEPLDNPATGSASKIIFTIKVANLTTVPPSWRWSVRFSVPGYGPPVAPIVGAQEDWFVSMISSDNAAPTFTYGTTGVFQGAARFFTTVGNLDPASNYKADGTITLVLPKETFRSKAVCTGACGPMNPGQAISLSLGSVRFSPPSEVPGSGGTNETIPDTTGAGAYVLRPASLCLPNNAPFAKLTANTSGGPAPLTVTFNGTGSSDADSIDSIATYTFNFNDGGDDVVQTSPVITHNFPSGGFYDVKLVVTDSRGKVSSNTAHAFVEVKQTAAPSAAQLMNISSRLRVQTGDNILIGGFIVTGSDQKKVAVRAIGPSTQVPGFLSDPTLELHDGTGALVTSNDDWKDSPERSQIEAAGLAPGNDKESVILRTLSPGRYTAVVRGKDNGAGTGVVEAYDLDATNNSKLANLSTRGFVETGDNILIGGFIAGNRIGNINVLVRAIGPSLAGLVSNPLGDPFLELHDSNGLTMATNDNWQDNQKTEIQNTGIPPTDLKESAMLLSLAPGNYTAIVRGVNNTTGNGLVEVYNVP